MSKADTMFEELGYKKVQDCSGLHYFRGEKYIEFSAFNKGVSCGNSESIYETEYLMPSELKAINVKMQELRWE